MGFIKSFKPWQLIVLLAVLIVGSGGSYGIYSVFTGPDESDLEANQQLVPVQLGNLVNEVSVNGSIVYPNREVLTFSSQGTLAELLVVEGQRVLENDPLASLDSETVANLERSVAQAGVTLRDAEKALDEFSQPASELQIAQAESKVVGAEIALSSAIETLDLLQNATELQIAQAVAKVAGADIAVSGAIEALDLLQDPTELQIAQAEAKVAGAETALSSAIETLDLLQNPTQLQIAQAEAKIAGASLTLVNAQDALDKLNEPASQAIASAELRVASAELALQSATDLLEMLQQPASALAIAQAEAKLTEAKLVEAKAAESMEALMAGPSPEELSDASQKIESAQTALANTVAELSFVTGDWQRKLESASTELQREADAYLNELKGWLGVELDAGLLDGNVDVVLDALGADLAILFEPGLRFVDLSHGGYFSEGLPTDDPETGWNEVIVFTWLNLSPAEIVATCDQAAAPAQGFCVRQELDAAAAAYQKAVDNLDSQTVQSAKATEAAEGAVAKAEDALTTSQDALADLTEPADALSIEDAERQLALASASVQNAEDALAETLEPTSQVALDDQAAQVELARANLLQAIEELSELTGPPDDAVLGNQRTQVDLARASLAQAEEELSELTAPPDDAVLANQQKQVDLAKASLAQAEEELSVLEGPPDDAVLANQLEQVDLAKASLAQAQEDLSELTGPPDDAVLGNQQTQIDLAKASLAQAEEDLAQLLADPDPAELEAKRLGVEVARLNLDELTVELADLKLDPDPLDLSLVQANVATAQAALDQAETKLASAIIRAPWAGVISTIAVEVGDNVNLSTPIIEMVDPNVVEIDGMVDEIDVLFVRLGSRSVVSMDALPGQLMEGTVSSIDSAPRNQQGVVSYPLRIRVTPPEGMDLPEGLSAVASVVIREDRGVLLVPIQSLYGSFEEPTVKVIVDGRIVDRPVVLGNNDDFWAVVSDGVAEGDLVIMQSQETQTDRFRFGAAFRGGAVLGAGGGRGRR